MIEGAAMFLETAVHLKHAEHEALEHAAVIIETEAKESLGHYQSGCRFFPAAFQP